MRINAGASIYTVQEHGRSQSISQSNHDHHDDITTTLPRIVIPPIVPVTPEEIERRRVLIERILRNREKTKPLGIDAAKLIDMDFYEVDAEDE